MTTTPARPRIAADHPTLKAAQKKLSDLKARRHEIEHAILTAETRQPRNDRDSRAAELLGDVPPGKSPPTLAALQHERVALDEAIARQKQRVCDAHLSAAREIAPDYQDEHTRLSRAVVDAVVSLLKAQDDLDAFRQNTIAKAIGHSAQTFFRGVKTAQLPLLPRLLAHRNQTTSAKFLRDNAWAFTNGRGK